MKCMLGVLLFLCFGSVSAAVVTISTSDNPIDPGFDNQGWVKPFQEACGCGGDNYATGYNDFFRSYYIFDLSSIDETVLSATLELRRYNSSEGAVIEFYDVSTSPENLIRSRTTTLLGTTYGEVHADLGSGTNYGSSVIGPGDTFDILSFELNAAAISDIDSATGYFAIGARIATESVATLGLHAFAYSNDETGGSFGSTNYTQQLVLTTVPIPTTAWLLSSALGLLGWMRRKAA